MVRRALLTLGALLASMPAWAQQVMLQADTHTLSAGQRTPIAVIVTGANPTSVPTFTTPNGVSVSYNGQSQTTSIVNGHMERYIKFVFDMVAREEGTFTVGPAVVDVQTATGTSAMSSNTIPLVVGPRAAQTSDADVEVYTSFNTPTAWQGQIVLFTYGLRSRKQLASNRWFGLPDEGLLLPKDARGDRHQYVVNDERGAVLVDETVMPFIVTGAGPLTWAGPALEADLIVNNGERRSLSFFRRTKRDVFTSDDLRLDVRPLPEAPDDFTGLVGNFTIRARIPSKRVKVGESIPFTLHIEGDGTLEGFSLPPMPDVDGVRVYEGSSRVRNAVRSSKFIGSASYERSIVPTREGSIELPDVELVVFSPDAGTYVTLRARLGRIHVDPGEGGEVDLTSFASSNGDPEALEATAPDEVRPLWGSGPNRRLPWPLWMPLTWLVAALPGAWVISATAAAAWRRRQTTAQQTTAQATPLERLDRLPPPGPARVAALDEALRLALALASDVPVAHLDRDAALSTLPPALAEQITSVTAVLDRVRFAGAPPPEDLDEQVRAVIRALETP